MSREMVKRGAATVEEDVVDNMMIAGQPRSGTLGRTGVLLHRLLRRGCPRRRPIRGHLVHLLRRHGQNGRQIPGGHPAAIHGVLHGGEDRGGGHHHGGSDKINVPEFDGEEEAGLGGTRARGYLRAGQRLEEDDTPQAGEAGLGLVQPPERQGMA